MDGHCYGCATKFGFFNKEHACHKCGHAYCKNCLPHKMVLPGKDAKKPQNVCSSCFKLLQQPDSQTHSDNLSNEGKYSPPENFKKRVAALQQKEQTQGTKSIGVKGHQKHDGLSSPKIKPAAKYKNMSPQDRDITMRLEKLQEERKKKEKPGISETEIEDRLRKLRGLPPTSETSLQPVYQAPSNKTLEEQYDDLLNQMTEEAALDARLEGRDTPKPVSSYKHSSSSQSGLGYDPLLPTGDEMRQLQEDATKLLGTHGDGQARIPTSGQASSNPHDQRAIQTSSQSLEGEGETGGQQEGLNEEAERLAEEASKLMDAARAELIQEEESAKRDAEISNRLAQLQDRGLSSNPAASGGVQYSDEGEDEEEATQRLIQQLLEESKLDDKVAADGFDVSSKEPPAEQSREKIVIDPKPVTPRPPTDPDELPWCCICNEDAILRCLDCDGDLFCQRCFREGHRDHGIESHRSKPYKKLSK